MSKASDAGHVRQGPGTMSHDDGVRVFVMCLESHVKKFECKVQVTANKDLIKNGKFFSFIHSSVHPSFIGGTGI